MKIALAAAFVLALAAICVMGSGCTVTMSATERGATIGVGFDPASIIRALVDDNDNDRRRR